MWKSDQNHKILFIYVTVISFYKFGGSNLLVKSFVCWAFGNLWNTCYCGIIWSQSLFCYCCLHPLNVVNFFFAINISVNEGHVNAPQDFIDTVNFMMPDCIMWRVWRAEMFGMYLLCWHVNSNTGVTFNFSLCWLVHSRSLIGLAPYKYLF